MATQLSVFNDSLGILGEPPLQSVDQEIEAGRQLRDKWPGTVRHCLEQGDWNFASRRGELSRVATPPVWGWDYAYNLPADCVRVCEVSDTGERWGYFTEYAHEEGMIATNATTLFLRYMSLTLMDTPGAWSQSFADFVSAELALRVGPKLNIANVPLAKDWMIGRKKIALSQDAVQNPPQLRRPGLLAMAASGRGWPRRSGSSEQG